VSAAGVDGGIDKMITYTITAPLVDGTSYERTESVSTADFSIGSWDQIEGYTFRKILVSFANTRNVGADGGETHKNINFNSRSEVYPYDNNDRYITAITSVGDERIYQPNGDYENIGTYADSRGGYIQDPDAITEFSTTLNNSLKSHVMASLTAAPKDSASNNISGAGGPPLQVDIGYTTFSQSRSTFSQSRFFNTIALQTTTKTTLTNYGKVTTTTQQKIAKVGTTITQSVGTSVVTLPTTTNAKSWTENTTTNTEATEDATVVTTSMGIDSYWKKTAHTIYILKNGETAAFLKSDVALNATNGGPTDTKAYDTYSGPTTFTITRAAGTTSQKPVVADTVTDTSFVTAEGSQTTVTERRIVAANSSATIYTSRGSPFRFNLPLLSTSRVVQTGVSESSSTRGGWKEGTGSWGANAPTTTRSAWGETSVTYSLAGVSWTAGYATYTKATYAQPILRSGSGSYQNDGPTLDDDGNEVEGITFSGETASGFGESGNYFVNYRNDRTFRNNPDGAGAAYGLAYAWGTLGGTTATPRQSISVSGIASSESVTWPMVSISAGVQTPLPSILVSQKPATSATSSTAATKTEVTTRRIWGDEFGKTTSSKNSSTGTSGSTTEQIQAGGGAITSFQLGGIDSRGFPLGDLAGGWIPVPTVYVIGGIAQTGSSTVIIPPGEYVNSSFAEPKSFSGSSIANTYFESKAGSVYLCYPSP
jgi:hypothetical protein